MTTPTPGAGEFPLTDEQAIHALSNALRGYTIFEPVQLVVQTGTWDPVDGLTDKGRAVVNAIAEATVALRAQAAEGGKEKARIVAWVIPQSRQFSWDQQDERFWTRITNQPTATPEAAEGGKGEAGWLPIESAPKDGTSVLAWCDGNLVPSVAYNSNGRWLHSQGYVLRITPTHWMPLPKSPAPGAGGCRDGEAA